MLDEYRRKRDFRRTPEPAPSAPDRRDGLSSFVVHRHEARRLHYDLRLVMDGVLKSFAVPKGFSYRPSDKHLAVRTEDHPIEYETFEGMIPKGEYGAGTMTIWDHGPYRCLTPGDPAAAIESGKIEIELFGHRLRGEWHMVRTKQGWLMFKARDRHAAADGVPALDMDLGRAVRAELPLRPRVMTAAAEVAPFSAPDWLFEAEFDGRRTLVRKRGDDVAFVGQRAWAGRLPALVADLRALRSDTALVDGVLLVLDEHGRPCREALQQAIAAGGDGVLYYAFDLLHFDGWDLRGLALLDRKAALAKVLPKGLGVQFVDHVVGAGDELARTVAAAGLGGVIGKRAASHYRAGPSDDWRRLRVEPDAGARDVAVGEALERSAVPARKRSTRVELSNLDKIYWPAEGYTKGDLLLFYEQAADLLLPHLHERPVHLYRWPDGIEGKSFYQQSAPDGCPSWVATEVIRRRHKEEPVRHMICNDRDTLLYLINLGSIDIHPWMSRRGSLESPDYAVIDLDPKSAPFSDVIKIARETGKLLRGIGLRPLLKTSGASGLHIYVPLCPGYSYEHARMFCEGVARWIAKEHQQIATVERNLAQRRGRVYIDFGQNRRGQTVVPPYAVRPVPGATVSTPLGWDELGPDLHPSLFTIKTLPPRLEQRGDLFRPLLMDPQDLMPAIAALQELLGGRR